jgi:cysteine sulfinate desulfinase/cysteine desulfurase-like protein
MGIERGRALGAVRLSLGHPTTAEEVDAAATALLASVGAAVGPVG